MMKAKLKYLLPLLVISGLTAPLITNAWCCRKISWGFINPPVVVHLGEVFDVNTEQKCLDTCSGSLTLGCQNFYRKDATTDTANNACVSATTGCCQVTATLITTERFVYSANDQEECNYYCKALAGCTSVYKKGLVPNTSNGLCESPKTPNDDKDKDKSANIAKEIKGYTYSTLTNPLGTVNPSEVVGKVIKAILAIIGSIFLLLVVYGGFTWMTAAGNDARVERGRNTIIWAAVGLVVIFAAWMLTGFVLEALGVAKK